MFTTQYDSITASSALKTINETILPAINSPKARGIIFGSTLHQLLSGLSYRANDVDILCTSVQEMISFKNIMTANSKYTVDIINYAPSYVYSFSHYIVGDNAHTLRMSIWDKATGYRHDYRTCIYVHCHVINLNMFNKHEQEVIQRRDVASAELLASKIAVLDFMGNFYMNGSIYHKLNDLVNVGLPSLDVSKKLSVIIRKYTKRGVKFTLIDVSNKIAPSVEILTKAKDDYRSKGLTVIPLSCKDVDMAGKAPAVANWTSLSKSFNFTVTYTCANIGIICGPSSGIICIDVDVKDRGVEMFNKMVQHYGPLPAGVAIQRTGNNGFHYIFKYNDARMSNMMAKIKCPKLNDARIGVDMWIQQCQFVAAPSVNYTNGRTYTWIAPIKTVEALPDLPEWIYQLYELENITEHGIIVQPEVIKTITPTEVITQDECVTEADIESDDEQDYHESISDNASECNSKFNYDIGFDYNFEQLLSYKQMLMEHPEYLIGLLIILIMIMSMIGFIILIMVVLAIFYHKQIQKIVSDYIQTETIE